MRPEQALVAVSRLCITISLVVRAFVNPLRWSLISSISSLTWHGAATALSSVLQAADDVGIAAIISSLIFLLVFIAISFQLLHETAAAMLGAAATLLLTYILGSNNPALHILTFDQAMGAVDWNVIFLIMGMMSFMAILAETNIFRWMAIRFYHASRGNTWLLTLSLLLLTGITSALLNDVTVILLLVPLSIQLALAIGIHPYTLVIPEVLISNIGGAGTLIGNPPSTIVGSHIGVGFVHYLANMVPIVLICTAVVILIVWLLYRSEFAEQKNESSSVLVEKLSADADIRNRDTLIKAGVIGLLIIIGFVVADQFEMPPGVVAFSGAALLIAWVRPDMSRMIREVDWTTLLFFIGLFIVVGGMEATGAIQWLATRIAVVAGQNADRAALLTTWVSAIASAIVANIPFTVAALPVADFLTSMIPGAESSGIVYWALVLGADLGGNATILGSAPNIVAVGLLAQAGYRLSFKRFARDGVIVTAATLVLASIWLLVRY